MMPVNPAPPQIIADALTLVIAAAGAGAAWLMWQNYMGKPWTRDGTVRANVVTLAPDIAGQVVQLPVKDNQFVHKGDFLIKIDPATTKSRSISARPLSIRPMRITRIRRSRRPVVSHCPI